MMVDLERGPLLLADGLSRGTEEGQCYFLSGAQAQSRFSALVKVLDR